MIVVGYISILPTTAASGIIEKYIREVVVNNIPADIMTASTKIILDADIKDNEITDTERKRLYGSINQGVQRHFESMFLTQHIEKYDEFVRNSVKNKFNVKRGKIPSVLNYKLSYYLKINADAIQIEPDEDGVEPTDDEMFQSYDSPLIPIDSQFLKHIQENDVPPEIEIYFDDILNFRQSAMAKDDGRKSYFLDITSNEFMLQYLSDAENIMLGYKI